MSERSAGPLVLASGSRTRREMLTAAGLAFEIVPAEVDEDALTADLRKAGRAVAPEEIARALARAKAREVAGRRPGALVIGGDSVLAVGSDLLVKPGSIAGARASLERLRGRTHAIHSAAALVAAGAADWVGHATARLTMRAFSDAFLERYLAEAGPGICGSVGAYHLEGLGVQLFERVEGDYFTILGLPLVELLAELRRRGAIET